MYFVASSMASEPPDPSSSELLTDFDIADIENWDDQNDNSKDMDLVKMSSAYGASQMVIPKMSIPSKDDRNDHPLSLRPSAFSNNEQLRKITSSMQHQTWQLYQNDRILNQHQPMSPSTQTSNEPSQAKSTEPGHALAMLRALAQAQEEQAKLSEEQEQAKQMATEMVTEKSPWIGNQIMKQEDGESVSSENDGVEHIPSPVNSCSVQNGPAFANQEAFSNKEEKDKTNEQSTVSLNSLPSQADDQKQQASKSSKSVFQLKGQLVRTPDQKFMLVTEVGGKKVGYLISPQSGQLQSTGIPQAIQKSETDNNQTQDSPQSIMNNAIVSKQDDSVPTTNSIPSTMNYADLDTNSIPNNASKIDTKMTLPLKPVTNENSKSTESKNLDDVGGEDGISLANVAATLKNTHLGPTSQVEKVKKKRRGKGKKKRDSNEPVKPISPYLMFFKDIQASIRQQNPKAGLGEVSKLISQQWEKSTPEQKQVYLDRSTKAKEEYQIKLAEYRASLVVTTGDSPSSVDSNIVGSKSEPIVINTSSESAIETPEKSQSMEWSHETSNSAPSSFPSNGSPVYNYVSSASNDMKKQMNHLNLQSRVHDIQHDDVTMESNHYPDSPNTDLIAEQGGQKSSKKVKDHNERSNVDSEAGAKRLKITRKNNDANTENDIIVSKNKSTKRSKKKQKLSPNESIKSPPKLTMKINIKDSVITESPTKSPDAVEERLPKEDARESSDENDNNSSSKDAKPSTQPKALLSFKIPLKKSSPTESKDGTNEKNKSTTKSSSYGPRQCANTGCEKSAKSNRERGPLYCSNQCLVEHCRNVFNDWVTERKSDAAELS